MIYNNLIGKTFEEARTILEQSGFSWRVTNVDGSSRIITDDYRPDRVNITLVNGIVLETSNG